MKRHLLTFAGCLLWALVSVAAPRTAQEAAEIAGRFAASQYQPVALRMQRAKMSSSAVQPMRLAYTQAQPDNTPALYIFNNTQQDSGFVIVSAEDNTRTILGYADNGSFDEQEMPANMRFWLQMYADEIARASQQPALRQTTDDTTYPAVSPLLGSIEWGQDEPYNNLCPILNGDRCVTGCVATAATQIMYHYQYPVKGKGSHSYTWNGQTLSANFGSTTYNWADMLPVYSGAGYTTTQADAVATLMSHMGIACDMNYDTNTNGGSGAVSNSALQALIRYFDYDAAIRVLPKDYMDESEMLGIIAQDLQAGHPIFMSGRTTNDEGHAFVLDGMQTNGYVHINWGWDGYSNGYFAISAMNPYGQGTGGAASGQGFTESVCAFTGIQPNQGGDSIPLIMADTVKCVSQRRIGINENLAFSINPFQNSGVTVSKGKITYIIYKDGQYYTQMPIYANYNLPPGHYYTTPYTVYRSVSSLSAGEYELALGVLPDNSNTAYPILTRIARGERRFPLTVTADSVFLGEGNVNQEDKADLNFADAYIFDYTDYYEVNFLQVELHTADYKMQNGVVVAGTALQLGLIPTDRSSIVGTYLFRNSIDAGTLYSENGLTAINYAGGNGTAYSDSFSSGVTTVTIDSLGKYVFNIELVGNKKIYTITCSLSEDDLLIGKYNVSDKNLDYSSLENKTITSLTVAEAKNLIATLPDADATAVPYLVRGVVSQLVNTPEQIKNNGSARFYISDDGTTDGHLYCYNTYWLNNVCFATGEELAVGDTVVVCSPLQKYASVTPELPRGYVYYHAKAPEKHEFAIRIHVPETSGLDTSNGLLVYFRADGKLYTILPQEESNNWWSVNLTLATDSIECVLTTPDVAQQTYFSPKFPYGNTCLLMGENSNSTEETANYWNLYIGECDAFTDIYLPTNLQVSVSVAGADFIWDSPKNTSYEVRLKQVGSESYSTYYRDSKNLGLIFTGAYTFGWQVRAVNDNLVPISDFVQGENFTTLENPYLPTNLVATTHDSTTYYFAWDADVPAPQYRIRIVLNGKVYYYADVESVPVSLTFDINGYYTWQVYALDANGNTMGFANGGSFKVADIPDYTISNLKAVCNGSTATASWTSNAPKYLVACSNRQDTIIDTRYYRITNLENGEYSLEITPVDRYERYIIGDEQTTTFTINTTAQPEEYQLTIAGLSGGTVNAEVNGKYPIGTSIQIEATPDTGYRFQRWSDDNTDAVRTIILTGDTTLTASFEAVMSYKIKIAEADGGTTTPTAGIHSYNDGDLLTVFAHPDENHTFSHWLIDGVQTTGNPLLHIVESAAHIEALFAKRNAPQLYYTLTLSADEGGTVSARPWLDKYLTGTTISIEATPEEGYLFERWSDGDTNSKRSVVISSDTTLTAIFYQQSTAMHNALNSNTIRVIEHSVEVQTTDYTTIYLYLADIAGRIIACVRNTRYARFVVPAAGVYIVRCDGEATKILIQ